MILKGNRQIGLDGRIFINDCLSDGLFFVYSIMLSGILGAVGDIMKLTGKSGTVMNTLTNGLILMDLACCLGLVLVSYYVYFMNCGESMPKLGVKPLIYLDMSDWLTTVCCYMMCCTGFVTRFFTADIIPSPCRCSM